ncbi:unnamed protein product [Cunninghamella blakesleeana]
MTTTSTNVLSEQTNNINQKAKKQSPTTSPVTDNNKKKEKKVESIHKLNEKTMTLESFASYPSSSSFSSFKVSIQPVNNMKPYPYPPSQQPLPPNNTYPFYPNPLPYPPGPQQQQSLPTNQLVNGIHSYATTPYTIPFPSNNINELKMQPSINSPVSSESSSSISPFYYPYPQYHPEMMYNMYPIANHPDSSNPISTHNATNNNNNNNNSIHYTFHPYHMQYNQIHNRSFSTTTVDQRQTTIQIVPKDQLKKTTGHRKTKSKAKAGLTTYLESLPEFIIPSGYKVTCIKTVKMANTVLKNIISEGKVYGVDIEWKPCFVKGGKQSKTGIIQIFGGGNEIFIIQLSQMNELPRELIRFLESKTIYKTGVNIIGDGKKLVRDFGIYTNGLIDLIHLSNEFGKPLTDEVHGKSLRALIGLYVNIYIYIYIYIR